MIKIHFIINPISGSGKHHIDENLLSKYFPADQYDLKTFYSTYKKEAILLTKQSITENPDIIVACGGDGTIHEVATQLIGKDISLGIISAGSGNGLSSNLSIPKEIDLAIECIKRNKTKRIDVGCVNKRYFFSNMGFGIDAKIIKKYEKSGSRKIGSYVKAALNSAIDYRAKKMEVSYNGITKTVNPLLLFVSNSNEMGYHMSLTPNASLRDGLLDFLLVPKIGIFKQIYFGILVILRQSHRFKNAEYSQLKSMKVKILKSKKNTLQLDGEYYKFNTDTFKIKVLHKSLKVIC